MTTVIWLDEDEDVDEKVGTSWHFGTLKVIWRHKVEPRGIYVYMVVKQVWQRREASKEKIGLRDKLCVWFYEIVVQKKREGRIEMERTILPFVVLKDEGRWWDSKEAKQETLEQSFLTIFSHLTLVLIYPQLYAWFKHRYYTFLWYLRSRLSDRGRRFEACSANLSWRYLSIIDCLILISIAAKRWSLIVQECCRVVSSPFELRRRASVWDIC